MACIQDATIVYAYLWNDSPQALVEASLVAFNNKNFEAVVTNLNFMFDYIENRPKPLDMCFEVLLRAAEALVDEDIKHAIVHLVTALRLACILYAFYRYKRQCQRIIPIIC